MHINSKNREKKVVKEGMFRGEGAIGDRGDEGEVAVVSAPDNQPVQYIQFNSLIEWSGLGPFLLSLVRSLAS